MAAPFLADSVVLQSAAVATGNGTVMSVRGMSVVGCQVVGITTATITFEVAGDDVPTWVAIVAKNMNSGTEGTTATADGLYSVPVQGCNRLRARISAYTSGTITVSGTGIAAGVQITNTSVAAVIGAVDTELPTAAALADGASAAPTTPTVGAITLLMNATTEDRARAVVNALDSTGTGIAAAGMVAQLDDTSPGTVTENQFSTLRMSARRILYVEGHVANDAADAGNPIKVGGIARAPDTLPADVTAADRVDMLCDLKGRPIVYVATKLDSTNDRVGVEATTTGGATLYKTRNLAATVQAVNASAGALYGITILNDQAALACYVQLFNVASGSVTLGTTTPDLEYRVPASTSLTIPIPSPGIAFGTALSVASTTLEGGSVGSVAGVMVFIQYK